MERNDFNMRKTIHHKPFVWRLLIVAILCLIVALGIFSIFAQFDTTSVPEQTFTHNIENAFTYYEWDDEGVRHELKAVYSQYGFFETVTGSDFMDKARESVAGDSENEDADDGIPDGEGPVGQLPVGKIPVVVNLSAVKNMAVTSDAEEFDAAGPDDSAPARHRFGFSVKLEKTIDSAQLVLNSAGGISYVAFLDDHLLYTDFPGESASLSAPPAGTGGILEQYNAGKSRSISVSLPDDYTEKTLTVIEYLTCEQAAFWDPVTPRVITPETDSVLAVINYGADGIMAGMIAAILVILTVLFIRQILSGQKPFLLLLPIAYALIYMITKADFISFYSTSFINGIQNLIFAFSLYCAGDLLLIFLAFKMKRPVHFGLATGAAVHFLIASGMLLQKFCSGEFLLIPEKWFGIFGFAVLLFAVVLMFTERKTSRYLKHIGWMFLTICAGYGILTLVFYFTDQGMFVELSSPLTAAAGSLHFDELNRHLSVFMMVVITVCSMIDYVTELTENRIRLTSLEQINRLKTEFLGNVSHELKTPLTVMSSYAQITEKSMAKQPGTEELSHHMKLIKSEAERLSLMVSQILDVTRIEENRLNIQTCSCDLAQIIKTALDTYYPVFSKNRNKLVFNPPAEGINVLCDPDRIMQVLVNLIGNAAKHTQNGVITVRVRSEEGAATVEVTDTGKGMDAQQIAHAFDRYYTSENNKKSGAGQNTGTGLGLYICQHIIKEHGGEISIRSEAGQGTTVRFTVLLSQKS